MRLIIEHCEPYVSEWLLLEYKHAVKLWQPEPVIFTNVRSDDDIKLLAELAPVEEKSVAIILKNEPCIVLDPSADTMLRSEDFSEVDNIVLGGILGASPPAGRTKTITSRLAHARPRSLGAVQLSIDGAVCVAKAVALGAALENIEIASEVELQHNGVHSTVLPFGYPLMDGKLIITPGLIEYLCRGGRAAMRQTADLL